jgi:hypothetical protein
MRVATLYETHGNLSALDAVLREIPDEAMIVVGGDICAGGTRPSETLEHMRAHANACAGCVATPIES